MVSVPRSGVLLLIAAVVLTSGRDLLAQTSDGRDEYERATKLFQNRDYESALASFEKAYVLSGHRPSTIRALAQCERALHLYDRAIGHFREYFATVPPDAASIEATIQLLLDERDRSMKEPGGASHERASSAGATPEPAKTPPPEKQQNEGRSAMTFDATPAAVHSDNILESPVLWIIAGVAVVAGGVALAFTLRSSDAYYGGTSNVVLVR
jgi:hypothetical protein